MRKSTYSVQYKRLIRSLRDARKSQGITQADLAKRLKRPQSFVAKYEQCERRLDVVEFLTVAKAIGVDAIPLIQAIQTD